MLYLHNRRFFIFFNSIPFFLLTNNKCIMLLKNHVNPQRSRHFSSLIKNVFLKSDEQHYYQTLSLTELHNCLGSVKFIF